jgi:hypothetical protein
MMDILFSYAYFACAFTAPILAFGVGFYYHDR